MELEDKIKDFIEILFYNALIKEVEEYRPEIHITDLSIPCLRRAYFNKLYEREHPELEVDKKSLKRLWIGKKLHETPLTRYHELELDYGNGLLKGQIDEMVKMKDGDKVILLIIDKKTTEYKVKEPHEHYKTQVEYYSALLKMIHPEYFNDVDEVWGVLLYITLKKEDDIIFFTWKIDVDKNVEELKNRIEEFSFALENNIIPDAIKGWWCNYCRWNTLCYKLDANKYEEVNNEE